jgi:hypothetical protein
VTSGKEKRARAPCKARALCGQGCRQEGGAGRCSAVQLLARVQGGGCAQAAEVPALCEGAAYCGGRGRRRPRESWGRGRRALISGQGPRLRRIELQGFFVQK